MNQNQNFWYKISLPFIRNTFCKVITMITTKMPNCNHIIFSFHQLSGWEKSKVNLMFFSATNKKIVTSVWQHDLYTLWTQTPIPPAGHVTQPIQLGLLFNPTQNPASEHIWLHQSKILGDLTGPYPISRTHSQPPEGHCHTPIPLRVMPNIHFSFNHVTNVQPSAS